MVRLSRLSGYITVYLVLCLIANLTLVVMFLGGQNKTSGITPGPPGTALHPADDSWSPSSGRPLTCSDLSAISNLSVIGAGWTKLVYKGHYGRYGLAVKTVHTYGQDMTDCHEPISDCYKQCASKIIKEMWMLKELTHPNIVKVYGECVPSEEYSPGPPATGTVALVTELGRPAKVVDILQMDFDERLKLASDIGSLLHHLAASPIGTLLMKDFRREQFVIVDGSLKLSDVDDIVIGDPSCSRHQDCDIPDGVEDTVLLRLACKNGECQGFNSHLNAIHASQHFMRILLPYGGPEALETTCINLLNEQAVGLLDSITLHHRIEAIVKNYSAGYYLSADERNIIKGYDVFHGSSVRGADFTCLKTIRVGCVRSISSPAEGALLCSQFPECVAFVLLDQWTWTGRQIAVLKTRVWEVEENQHHTLYIRRGQG